jgi:hypothetical protein
MRVGPRREKLQGKPHISHSEAHDSPSATGRCPGLLGEAGLAFGDASSVSRTGARWTDATATSGGVELGRPSAASPKTRSTGGGRGCCMRRTL